MQYFNAFLIEIYRYIGWRTLLDRLNYLVKDAFSEIKMFGQKWKNFKRQIQIFLNRNLYFFIQFLHTKNNNMQHCIWCFLYYFCLTFEVCRYLKILIILLFIKKLTICILVSKRNWNYVHTYNIFYLKWFQEKTVKFCSSSPELSWFISESRYYGRIDERNKYSPKIIKIFMYLKKT